jgi:hypothetical protein
MDPAPPAPAPTCQNCGAALAGPYCAACGQRDEREVRTIGHFAHEAFEGLTHADSRLWRTLWPLLSKPGLLTRDFFQGRRQAYLPPVRLYLVISLVFFLALSLQPSGGPVIVDGGAMRTGGEAAQSGGLCNLRYDGPGAEWLAPRLSSGCRKASMEEGSLGRAVLHNLPRALFVLLPLMAALMMLLYWRPRRHYVEHLLLLVHNHSALFLFLTLLMPLSLLISGTAAEGLVPLAGFAYALWYVYRSMRTYYRQDRVRTFGKFLVLGACFGIASLLLIVATLVWSVATL